MGEFEDRLAKGYLTDNVVIDERKDMTEPIHRVVEWLFECAIYGTRGLTIEDCEILIQDNHVYVRPIDHD